MLCGRFLMPAVPQQLLRGNLPGLMLVSCLDSSCPDRSAAEAVAGSRLARLIQLMQEEAAEHGPGSEAMMNHLSGALFGLTLRYASAGATSAARSAGAGRQAAPAARLRGHIR